MSIPQAHEIEYEEATIISAYGHERKTSQSHANLTSFSCKIYILDVAALEVIELETPSTVMWDGFFFYHMFREYTLACLGLRQIIAMKLWDLVPFKVVKITPPSVY